MNGGEPGQRKNTQERSQSQNHHKTKYQLGAEFQIHECFHLLSPDDSPANMGRSVPAQ
jgi:hypothetical protein